MTSLLKTDGSITNLKTPERLKDITDNVCKINSTKSARVLVTTEALNNYVYVRKQKHSTVGNHSSQYKLTSKLDLKNHKVTVGWKLTNKFQNKVFEFNIYYLRNYDYPFSDEIYTLMDKNGRWYNDNIFIIPAEAITVEQMLKEMMEV